MLQIAYNQLAGLIDLWVMLEGNVEVIFSILHTGLSWRARNSPWNLHPTEKWLLVQLSCSNAPFLVYADPWIYVTSSHIGTSMSFPPSRGLLWQWYLKCTCSNCLNVIRKVLFWSGKALCRKEVSARCNVQGIALGARVDQGIANNRTPVGTEFFPKNKILQHSCVFCRTFFYSPFEFGILQYIL